MNIYTRRSGRKIKGKINVQFYYPQTIQTDTMFFIIRDSLQITDEAEMIAILETVSRSEYFDAEAYGSVSYMRAEWLAHNYAYSMATGSKDEQQAVMGISGESLRSILARSKELDITPMIYLSEQEAAVYEIIQIYCMLNGR